MPEFRYQPRIATLDHLTERFRQVADRGPAYQTFFAEVARLAAGAKALVQLHASRDPTLPEAAHVKKIATAAKHLTGGINPALGRMSKAQTAHLTEIEKRKNQKVPLVPDEHDAEIRHVYRKMALKDQLKLLHQLAEEGRSAELAAIVKAPRVLTGLSDEHAKRFTDLIYERHAPDELAEEKQLMEAFDAALMSVDPVKELVTAYSNPAGLAEITRAEQAAAAAEKGFRDAAGSPTPGQP